MQLKNILVPIDFSEHSLHALQIASGLAADNGATLDLLHNWQPVATFTEQSPPAAVLAAQEQEARNRLEALQPARSGAKIRRHLSTGGPAEEIVRFAETHGTDLIVMGTYGRTGMTRWALGSVAEAVVRCAACPVLTCKLPAQLAPQQEGPARFAAAALLPRRPLGPSLGLADGAASPQAIPRRRSPGP